MVYEFIANLVSIVVDLFNDILNFSILPNISISVIILFVIVLGVVFSFPRYFL